MRNARLFAAAVAASLLAACGGGGSATSSLPSTPQMLPLSAGDFHATGAFTAVGDDMQTIKFFPTADSIGAVRQSLAISFASGSNLIYGGGPIEHAPKLYVVFWGSAWNGSGDPDGVKGRLENFLRHVGGSNWNSTVKQYYQNNPRLYAGNPSNNFDGAYVDTSSSPPSHPTQSQMAAEAKKAASHFNSYGYNTQIIVAMPHGIVPSGFKTQYCAYHASASTSKGNISWTNLPYLPDAGSGCGAGSVTGSKLDGVSIVEGHEMAEAETDPNANNGWLDSSGAEIGDKCAWVNLKNVSLNGTSFPMQPLWSNSAHGCVQ